MLTMIKTVFKSTTTRGPNKDYCFETHSLNIQTFLSTIKKEFKEVQITNTYSKTSQQFGIGGGGIHSDVVHTIESIIMYDDEKTNYTINGDIV